jgi:hypothetical protein
VRLPPLVVSDTDRAELQGRVRSHTTPQRAVMRARILLLAARGDTQPSDRGAGRSAPQPGRYRCPQRYAADGLAGPWSIATTTALPS